MRRSGILMPLFSLNGKYGIGTMGKSAFEFADFLCQAKQTLWQILPLTPTSYGNSPYQSPCVFAGNPYFIDPENLYEDALIDRNTLSCFESENTGLIDYGYLYKTRLPLLKKAAEGIPDCDSGYLSFCNKESFWLEKYCTFSALKEINNMLPHSLWKYKSASDIASAKELIGTHKKIQYLFFTQWLNLKKYANDKNIAIIGDLPIYPAYDSSDYYYSPDMFIEGRVAACPPDFFNSEGQLWGNPVYDWQKLKDENYSWWKERLKSASAIYDSIRIDHFRGFYEYYSTKKNHSAKEGYWTKGPALDFCNMVKRDFPHLDIIAEDLGFLTDDTRQFFRESGFATMKVLQFAFDDNDSEYLPHNHIRNSVVYTGTHDNPTLTEWICRVSGDTLTRAMDYLGAPSVYTLGDYFIRGAFSSVAERAVIPLQDWLKTGSIGRVNTPGTTENNWQWRIKDDLLTKNLIEKISHYTRIYNRIREE